MEKNPKAPSALPLRGSLAPAYAASILIALLTASASIAGMLYPGILYPDDVLFQSFVPNDAVNLMVGLPILIVSMALARRGRLLGLLLWPGALLYLFYNYLVYLFCMPYEPSFLAYLALTAASAYTIIALLAVIDGEAVRKRLSGAVPEQLCGGVLAGLGALFLLRIAGNVTGSAGGATAVERAVDTADFLASPAWIIGGVLLWRRKALGYAGGLGLLFSLSMLFIGLIFFFFLEPALIAVPFRAIDVLVVLIMGMIVFVPMGMFLRGMMGKPSSPPLLPTDVGRRE
ncbi:MAG: hypothetical protein ACK2UB_09215 [Anaerolineales bacterium]